MKKMFASLLFAAFLTVTIMTSLFVGTTIAYANPAPNTPTAEGICIDTDDNNAIYTTQIHGASGIVNLYKNGEYVNYFTNLGHANDLAYYNNHIYIASYDSNKIYRLKRLVDSKGSNVYKYDKAYTMDDDSQAWNIATYKKDGNNKQLFIIGTSGNNQKNLSFKIAYFRDTDNTFITVGSFTVPNPNSSFSSVTEPNILQGIAYKPDTEYLQICLSNKDQQGNKIVAIKMTMTSGAKAYALQEETIRAFNDFVPAKKPKFEIEGMAVDSNYRYYALVNEAGGSDPVYQVGISGSTWVINSTAFNTNIGGNDIGPPTPTAEGICVDTDDNNAIYTTQIDGKAGITALYKNGKFVAAFANLEHANDLAYYNNHIYVAAYSSNCIYRLKRSNDVYEYDKTYTLDDNSPVWNIATYKKDSNNKQLFIIGTSGNNRKNLSFKIAYFRDTDNKFITVGSFTVPNPNSSFFSVTEPNILQGIAYKPDTEYLQICLSNKNQQGNKIVAIKMTMTSGAKAYALREETIRAFNDFVPAKKPKFEIEGMAVDSNHRYYALVNEAGGSDPVYHIGISGGNWVINSAIFNTAP